MVTPAVDKSDIPEIASAWPLDSCHEDAAESRSERAKTDAAVVPATGSATSNATSKVRHGRSRTSRHAKRAVRPKATGARLIRVSC